MRKQPAAYSALLLNLLKGLGAAIAVSVVLVLLFALIIKEFAIPTGLINPINQGIKVISILLGVTLAVGRGGEKGFLKGLLIGGVYMVVGIALAIVLGEAPPEPFAAVAEIALGALVGAICGILAVNVAPKLAKAR